MLTKLAVHYFRPDFTEAQAKSQISDMLTDLQEFTTAEVEVAITAYRRAAPAPGKQKYFPDSGTLRAMIFAARKERAALDKIGQPIGDRDIRPCLWWMRPRGCWRDHWRESDVPPGELVRDKTTGMLRQPERC